MRRSSCRRPAAARRGAGGSARRPPAAAASDPVPAWRARYWVPPRCRSDRRSSGDARRCRAAPAPAGGGRPRPRHRSPPAGASGHDWYWRPAGYRRIGAPARRRAPISARTATNAKKNVSACMLCPRQMAFLQVSLRRKRIGSDAPNGERSLRSGPNLNSPRQKLPPAILITHKSAGPKRLLAVPIAMISLVNAAFVAKMRSDRRWRTNRPRGATKPARDFNQLLTIHAANSAHLAASCRQGEGERRDVHQRSSGAGGVAYQNAVAPGAPARAR